MKEVLAKTIARTTFLVVVALQDEVGGGQSHMPLEENSEVSISVAIHIIPCDGVVATEGEVQFARMLRESTITDERKCLVAGWASFGIC